MLMLFSTQSQRLNPLNQAPNAAVYNAETQVPVPAVKVQQLTNITETSPMATTLPVTAIPVGSLSSKPSSTSSVSSNEMRRRGSSYSREHSSTARIDSMTRSPGPASAALASGDSSNKAIVAAAALAAAAATPIPILHKPVFVETEKKEFDGVDSTHSQLAKPIDLSMSAKGKQTVKVEDASLEPARKIKEEDHSKNKSSSKIQNQQYLKEEHPRKKQNTKQERPSIKDNEKHTEKDHVVDHKDSGKDHTYDNKDNKVKEDEESKNNSELPSYAVGPDSGIISCICGYDHDDGLTIQCDKCFRWQHLVCMGFESITDTPDDFQCNLCNKNLHVDAAKARKLQEAYLKEEKSKRHKSPDTAKETKKVVGAAQFKKRKVDDTSSELSGTEKYKTLYYPINHFVFKSPPIKSLFNQLPELLKKNKNILRVEKSGVNKLVLNPNSLYIKSAAENAKVKFTGISKLGLYAAKPIKENSCLSLLSGEIDTKQNYILDKVNKYWLLGCPKPNVFFHPSLPMVVDQRGLGNYTRFIRKSCKPNCEIRTIIVNKTEISLGIFSIREIKAEQEITLPWEWDVDHPILRIANNSESFENMNADTKLVLVNSIQSLLEITDCACMSSSPSECLINKVKKSSAYLQRNTRKNNISHLSPTPNQKYVPIEDRFIDRNSYLLASIESNGDMHIAESHKAEEGNASHEEPRFGASKGADGAMSRAASSNDEVKAETVSVNDFTFKPSYRKTLYNIHILPKKFELLRKYAMEKPAAGDTHTSSENGTGQGTEKPNGTVDVEPSMPIPIGVSPRILQKLNTIAHDPAMLTTKENGSNVVASLEEVQMEEKPKIVKKFSLADYKKKKTG